MRRISPVAAVHVTSYDYIREGAALLSFPEVFDSLGRAFELSAPFLHMVLALVERVLKYAKTLYTIAKK